MRSIKELSYRLRQEAANAVLYAFSPLSRSLSATSPLAALPSPSKIAESIYQSPYKVELLRLADQVLQGRIPILGIEVDYGAIPKWRRDPLRGKETPRDYFRFIPYLDVTVAGDHKIIWEINRHQHLVLLAQAFLATANPRYFEAVIRQLEDWWNDNPFQRGINWASALEVGFRALSWIWIWHLLGSKMPSTFRQRFLAELYRHGKHLEHNLSIYFSPNTHLLGEAVALHALGRLFPDWPKSDAWRERGGSIVREQMTAQVHADGSHFEQSTYYHVYALDFFLFHAVLEEVSEDYRSRLSRMTEFLASIVSPAGELAFLGDDDGGRLFHPFGPRTGFARGTLATASFMLNRSAFVYSEQDAQEVALWLLGSSRCKRAVVLPSPLSSRSFDDSGLVVMRRGDVTVLFDAGPLGPGNAGHSHADNLSLVVWRGSEEIFIDPGTYSYIDAEWRNAFRGTNAHNTVSIDSKDQAVAAGPFRWRDKPEVRLLEFVAVTDQHRAAAVCGYSGFSHKRTIELGDNGELDVVDEIEGPAGEHLIEQFWHLGCVPEQIAQNIWRIGKVAQLVVDGGQLEQGWRSRAFASKETAPVLVIRSRTALPTKLHARLRLQDM